MDNSDNKMFFNNLLTVHKIKLHIEDVNGFFGEPKNN